MNANSELANIKDTCTLKQRVIKEVEIHIEERKCHTSAKVIFYLMMFNLLESLLFFELSSLLLHTEKLLIRWQEYVR